MKYARNKRNDDLLEAVLLTRKVENLICPTCRKPVELRMPKDFDNYFAHKKGVVGMDACENYHPSMGSSISIQRNARLSRAKANLYLQYNVYRASPTWDLCLKIPKATFPKGEVRVVGGKFGVQSVFASDLVKGFRIVPLKVGVAHYRINCVGLQDEYLASKLSEGCTGLDPDGVNIFRFSNNICRMLRNDEPLFWGRRYFLVTKKTIVNTVPSFIRKEMLPTISTYNCALIEIPSYTDLDSSKRLALEEMINSIVRKELVKPLPRIELITPNVYYDEVDEVYEINDSSMLIVGVSSENGDQITEMEISDAEGELIQQIDINVRQYEIFRFKDERDFIELSLPQNPYESLLVRRTFFNVNDVKDIATITFRKASLIETIPVTSPLLQSYLRSVLQNELSLDSIDVLEKMPIHISYGTRGVQKRYEEYIMCNSSEDSGLNSINKKELLAKIDSLLKGLNSFTISIGNSASIRFGDDNEIEQILSENAKSQSVDKPTGFSKRVRWLMSYNNILENKGIAADREMGKIVSEFVAKKNWSDILQSHARISKTQFLMKNRKGDL